MHRLPPSAPLASHPAKKIVDEHLAVVHSITVADIAAALQAQPEATQQRCLVALIDGEPFDAGLVLLHAFTQAVEARTLCARDAATTTAGPEPTEAAQHHRTFIIAGC
ncbi:hypothetical protein [Paraburkholderia tuberum]|uniref:Uncharacterized protein n=1 Tax=Paraburkholderia tuberum TaxID=157910 RepID=A0A1H1GV20_9BURK|nr:hypothetical protein [Paraburkholderia tuberum]SDR17027.1 hypothetical protein SAMN05445850_3102 [Paraburkholderia tuberum]